MNATQKPLIGLEDIPLQPKKAAAKPKRKYTKSQGEQPANLGQAVRLKVPDFSDPNRPLVCLEVDFPMVPINALSNLEGNAGKPIYQMSKWWARRRSSVFRSLLIAAATQVPEDQTQAAKLVWDSYYANHQKAKNFDSLRVLDPFMGGGTTLVEGARLGFQMTGVDLNPVAWFVTKNELAGTEPAQVQAFFDHIEAEVKPLVLPLYTTTCPRGHEGQWIDVESEQVVEVDPLDLSPAERKRYRWEGAEVIYIMPFGYTFWAKHGQCQAPSCGHRTPIFKNPVIAEKKLSTFIIPFTCPSCDHPFQAELGETRMAPGAERVVLSQEPSFTEMSQPFAQLLKDYSKGRSDDKQKRVKQLLAMVVEEQGLYCPQCDGFAGEQIKQILEKHDHAKRISQINKKDFGIKRYPVQMYLLIHPDWLKGSAGYDEQGKELGGYVGAAPEITGEWFEQRLEGLRHIEVRGQKWPDEVTLADGTSLYTNEGTMPRGAHFTCGTCGRQQKNLEASGAASHTAPVAFYALQCHCPQCHAEGYRYGGRYFKAPDRYDLKRLVAAEYEWAERNESDLTDYWPREVIEFSHETHQRRPLPEHGYTHWWNMFNPRQLLVHTQLLQAIMSGSDGAEWPLDVREQGLGAFQQYLRMMCMFSFWHRTYDKLAPSLSNANFHPKQLVIETNVYGKLGYGRWDSCRNTVLKALAWSHTPWELAVSTTDAKAKSTKVYTNDPIIIGTDIHCTSSTDMSSLDNNELFDLVITDPPFGNNLYYADLADFFYVWLRIPLLKWYAGQPEEAYFTASRTPHAMEAITNPAEHPDDREDWEKDAKIKKKHMAAVRRLSGNQALLEKEPNPLYLPKPAAEFYRQTLTACWAEAGRLLKPGGIMAFTFHHNEDEAWIGVLEALFNAHFILVATYKK